VNPGINHEITIFGATGGTGRQLIEGALAGGYEVTDLVRNPSKLVVRHEHLTIIKANFMKC